MPDKIYMNALLDYYGVLLTQRQRTLCVYYFADDLSYQEIAEMEGISRTAVYDTISVSRTQLETYEAQLHLYDHAQRRNALYDALERMVPEQSVKDIVEQLRKIETEGE